MLIHYHPPKTAGTSLKDAFRAWFDLRNEANLSIEELRGLARLPNVCVSGHFASRLTGRDRALLNVYPDLVSSPQFMVVTAARDPVDHLVSLYYHELKLGNVERQSIESFIETKRFQSFREYFNITSNTSARRAVRSFFFTFVAEESERSIELLSEALDQPRVELKLKNVGIRDDQVLQLTRKRRARLEQALDLEFEFYQHARDNLLAGRVFDQAARAHQFEHTRIKRTPPPVELSTDIEEGETLEGDEEANQLGLDLLKQKDRQLEEAQRELSETEATVTTLKKLTDKLSEKTNALRGALEAGAANAEAKMNAQEDDHGMRVKAHKAREAKLLEDLSAYKALTERLASKVEAIKAAYGPAPAAVTQDGLMGGGRRRRRPPVRRVRTSRAGGGVRRVARRRPLGDDGPGVCQ